MTKQFVRNVVVALAVILTGCASVGNRSSRTDVRLVYFGHPYGTYNTPLEQGLVDCIQATIPGWILENPNQPQHEAGYRAWKVKTGRGMDYYFQVVLPKMHGGVFLPYRDGAWGAGVYDEALHVAQAGRPIWTISSECVISPTTPEQMRLTGGVLSITQTRERNKLPY